MLQAAPPVLKFDPEGSLLASWGGPSGGTWVKKEHGIHVDTDGNVWVGGNSDGDQILKFAPDGKFLQQVGKDDGPKGSLSQTRPAGAHDYRRRGGRDLLGRRLRQSPHCRVRCQNRCVQADVGAYGKPPSDDKMPPYKPDAKLSEQFANPVHCVRLSNGLVYMSATAPTTASRCSARMGHS